MGAKDEPPTRARQSKRSAGLSSVDASSPSAKVTGRARVRRKKMKGGRKQHPVYLDSVPPRMVAEVFDVSGTDEAAAAPAPVDRRLPPNGLPRPWSKPPAPHPPRPSIRPLAQPQEIELGDEDLEPAAESTASGAAPLLTPPPTEMRVPAGRSGGAALVTWLLVGTAALALGMVLGARRGGPALESTAVGAPRAPAASPSAAASEAILIALPTPNPGVLPSEPPAELESEAPSASASSPAAAAHAFEPATGAPAAPLAASGAPQQGPPQAATPAAEDPALGAAEPAPPFDAEGASTAIRAAFKRASGCRGPGDPTGEVTATLTYAPSGRVTSATVGGIFAGTAVGGCIAATLRGARVPAFSGEHVIVKRTALLK
jgi:hypothetical protein